MRISVNVLEYVGTWSEGHVAEVDGIDTRVAGFQTHTVFLCHHVHASAVGYNFLMAQLTQVQLVSARP